MHICPETHSELRFRRDQRDLDQGSAPSRRPVAGRALAAERQGSSATRPLGARRRPAEPRDAPRAAPRLRVRPGACARSIRDRRGARRPPREGSQSLPSGAPTGDAEGAWALMASNDPFDPYAVLRALDDRGVTYVVVGALGRVIHGSDELTDGIDVVPATREENLR